MTPKDHASNAASLGQALAGVLADAGCTADAAEALTETGWASAYLVARPGDAGDGYTHVPGTATKAVVIALLRERETDG